MTEQQTYPVPEHYRAIARLDETTYEAWYEASIRDNENFWRQHGQRIDWMRPYTRVKDVSYAPDDLHIRWYQDGVLNASCNCLDRHLAERGDQPALLWEPDNPQDPNRVLTYRELYELTCRLANGLRELGVNKGDVVTIYMPMVPEAVAAMLACARIGAIHSVVFAGFSPEALAGRMDDGRSRFVITADGGRRAGKLIDLKGNVDKAIEHCQRADVKHVLVVRHTDTPVNWHDGRDIDFHDLTERQPIECQPEPMQAEDPLFILYTSGSTGKPKGVLHTTGGYLVYVSMTHEYVFDCGPGSVYWCTADVGWITGHSYIVYGPLANGSTNVMFEGVPNFPTVGRMAQIVDKYQVEVLYTAPTAIRALMAHGEAPVAGAKLDSLRLLGTVGEPINPEAWRWYRRNFGRDRCPIVDTWWQTETGGILITPIPGVTPAKPGSATRPFFGIQPAIVDEAGNILESEAEGNLVLLDSWPGQMRTVYGDHQRFLETYFSRFPGKYFTGDGARRDADGYYWLTGRVDDVLNVSGHRLGTAEIESALVAHPAVSEAAVVGFPHAIKGQAIYAFVALNQGVEADESLAQELKQWVRKEISPIAEPEVIQFAAGLPKTRSGKIMRRILRKIANGDYDNLGDTSTLADPGVVEHLILERQRT
jgi:acetyl-CoA synthetase